MAKRGFVLGAYWLCRALGLFWVARLLTRSKLRVLCYHGFVLDDEDQFRDSLFVSRAFFDRRMRKLRDKGYPVMPLDEAARRLRDGTLPRNATAITIDDGFYSTYAVAREVLGAYNFPSTLYLTTYYFQKGTPVFQLAVDYMCWKSPRPVVDLSDLGVPALAGTAALDFSPARRKAVSKAIHAHGSSHLDEPGRVALSRRLAACLDVDYQRIVDSRMLSLVTAEELRTLQQSGMRIGLHTHRHRFPVDARDACAELDENRRAIEPVTGTTPSDFCFPNGDWSPMHRAILASSGISTATTCDSGLVGSDCDRFAIPRILDDNRVSSIEFEAELSGFCEIMRSVRSRWSGKVLAASFYCDSASATVSPLLAI